MKTAILYINGGFKDKRIRSFTSQEQLQSMEAFCVENNIRILETYTDDVQVPIFEQEQLQQMLNYIKSRRRKPDYILIKYWRCLAKDPRELIELIDGLFYKGIDVRSIYDFEESWFESMYYKYKTVDAEEVARMKGQGITCVTAFKQKEIRFL